jgi:hypothetical protein
MRAVAVFPSSPDFWLEGGPVKKKSVQIAGLALLCLAFGSGPVTAANSVSNADELLAQHLNSIANAQSRATLKTRVAQGPVEFRILVGGAGVLDGKAVLVSEGKKFQFMVKLPNNDYRGEQVIFNGDKDSVAFSSSRQTRSALGSFLFVQDAAIREGLWGGELSTAWPLLNLDERKAKISFEGLKKIDGQELYEVRYRPHKNTDLDIKLYFDSQTCRHVQTIYSYSTSESLPGLAPEFQNIGPDASTLRASPGSSPETQNARQFPNRYRLTEKFSNFETKDGVSLPTHYEIQFAQELQNGRTSLSDWDMKGLEISNNISVGPHNFDVK